MKSAVLERSDFQPENGKRTVSVIVPVFNAERHIEDCIRSLLNQSYPAHEIIVVDDGSTDRTSEIARRFDVTLIDREKNGGAAAARAHGASKASGEILAFLDSDCVAPPNWLETIAAEFDKDPELGGVGGRYEHPPQKSAFALAAKLEEEHAHAFATANPYGTNPPGGNSAFLKRVWDTARSGREIYLFREVKSGEDDFACNEIRAAAKVKFNEALSVWHLPRDSNGYLKRHINRGRSGALQWLARLNSQSDSSLKAYGGTRLFIASLAFFAQQKVSAWERIKVSFLFFLRSCCWIFGAVQLLAQRGYLNLKTWWNAALSVTHFWRPGRISKLFYFITSACNARCEFCFNLDNVINWKARKAVELSLEEVKKIALRFKRLPYLCISGGEPFMRPDLPDVIEVFHKVCRTQWVTIPTNASLTRMTLLMTQEILTRCPGLFLTIQVSLDSMHEEHDKSRKVQGGFKSMVDTLKGLTNLRKIYPNLRVQIATCYDDFNVERMSEMIAYCRENFEYDQQMFYLIRDGNLPVTRAKNHLIPSFLKTLEENERHEWSRHRRNLWSRAVRALHGISSADVLKIKREDGFIRPCHATRKFVTLYDDGQISPCEVLDSVNLGNIRNFNYDFYALIRRKKSKEFYKKEIVEKKCQCDWTCAAPMNMLYDPKVLPRLAKALIDPSSSVLQ